MNSFGVGAHLRQPVLVFFTKMLALLLELVLELGVLGSLGGPLLLGLLELEFPGRRRGVVESTLADSSSQV